MQATLPFLEQIDFPALRRAEVGTVQANMGYVCNQQCRHCHVNAGPKRTEQMTRETVEHILAYVNGTDTVHTLDLTGGAPELNPHFRYLAAGVRTSGRRVIDRCNLTILSEPGQEDLADFLAAEGIDIVASLPCYLEENVDKQRGKGVFERSITALRRLNALGYGVDGGTLTLDLVYNPQNAVLPPPQCSLEQDYKRFLSERYGIVFNRLLTLCNMPIQRFGSALLSKGAFDDYMRLLHEAHNPDNLNTVMCRALISVDWRGRVYDCDFNQMLDLPLLYENKSACGIADLKGVSLRDRPIRTAGHCYACTAGQGSSCGGALA